MTSKTEIVHQPHWRTGDEAAEIERDGYFETHRMVTPEEAARMQLRDYQATYAVAKVHALRDGLVEVQEGHFVKPGEVYFDDLGKRHIAGPK